jgi:hypothetical protein
MNMKPDFDFERQNDKYERASATIAEFISSGVLLHDLPEYIEGVFKRIEQTRPGINWLADNPGMVQQLVFEKLTVFSQWLKGAESIAPAEHTDAIRTAFDTIRTWQTYLANTYQVDTSRRYFADSILKGDDRHPEYLTNQNQPPVNQTRLDMEQKGRALAEHKAYIIRLAESQPRNIVLTKAGYCSANFMNLPDVRRYTHEHQLNTDTVKNWVKKHYSKNS